MAKYRPALFDTGKRGQRAVKHVRKVNAPKANPFDQIKRGNAPKPAVKRVVAKPGPRVGGSVKRTYKKASAPTRQKNPNGRSVGKSVVKGNKQGQAKYRRDHSVGRQVQALNQVIAHRGGKPFKLADGIQGPTKVAGVNISGPLSTLNRGVKPVKAPVLAALDQVSRVGHGEAGAALATLKAVKGGHIGSSGLGQGGVTNPTTAASTGFTRGVTLKERHNFGDVLREAGVKNKAVSGIAGFGLDVAVDPTTYLTGGVGSVGKEAALKAGTKTLARRESERASGKLASRAVQPTAKGAKSAEQSAKKALREGARSTPRKGVVAAKSPAEAKQIGTQARQRTDEAFAARVQKRRDTVAASRAAAKAEARAPKGRGVQVGLGKYKTTGKTSARVINAARVPVPARLSRTTAGVRNIGSELSPWIKPAGVTQKEFDAVKGAERQARATTNRGAYRAMQAGRALKDALPKAEYARVVDAVERGTVDQLKPFTSKVGHREIKHGDEKLYKAAREVERQLKKARRTEIKAGVETSQSGNVRYFPHELASIFEGGKDAAHTEKVPMRGGGGSAKFNVERADKRTIKNIAADGGNEFSTEIPAVVADRLAGSAKKVSKARLGNAVADVGQTLKPGATWDTRTEGVFLVRKGKAPKLLKDDEVATAKAKVAAGADVGTDKYVVANRRFVEQRIARVEGMSDRSQIGKVVDKGTGGFKTLATGTPGFHARNYIGDTFNSYLAQGSVGVAKNTRQAAAGLRHLGRDEKAAGTVGGRAKQTRMVSVKDKLGRKSEVPLSKLVKEAESHGVIRSGFVGRELEDLLQEQGGRITKVRGKGTSSKVKRAMNSREDINRLSTFLGARRNGMTAREAADHSAKYHFDYGDLSNVEKRVMRRAMPFYTFSSRNIPLQTKSLVSKPGKYATFEKARQEAAASLGLPEDWDSSKHLKEYQQRVAPFPIKVNGKITYLSSALPLTDLNQLSFLKRNPNTIDFAGEQGARLLSLLNPVVKAPAELYANYNSFFRGPIESDTSPLVAAPSFVGAFPDAAKQKLGIVKIIDKKSGKKVWGWPGKVAYSASAIFPGVGNFAQQISNPVANQRGQETPAKILSFVGGIKADPDDPEGTAIGNLFDEKTKLEKERSRLRQQGIGSAERGLRETKRYKQVKSRLKKIDYSITQQSTRRGDKQPLLDKGTSAAPSGGTDWRGNKAPGSGDWRTSG